MMWGYGWTAGDARRRVLPRRCGYGPNKGQANHSRFDLPAFNAAVRPQAARAARRPRARCAHARGQAAGRGLHAVQVHRAPHQPPTSTQPWLIGYRRHPFLRDWWRYVDIDRDEPQSARRHERAPSARRCCQRALARRGAASRRGCRHRLPSAAQRSPRCCATPSRSPRPASTRRRSATCIRASSPRTSSRRRTTTTTSRGRARCGRYCRWHARDLGRLPDLRRAAAARHLLRRRPGVRRQAARARRRGLRLRLKRIYDPATKSPSQSVLENEGIVGLRELREDALKHKRFDYDRSVEGLQALDRYTLRVHAARVAAALHLLAGRRPTSTARWRAKWSSATATASWSTRSAPARSGSKEWRRSSSKIVLERNPRYRERFYDAEPNADDDAEGRPLRRASRAGGCRCSTGSRSSIIEEEQPRWLAFLNERARPAASRAAAEFIDAGRAATASWRRTSPSAACSAAARAGRRRAADRLQHGASGDRRLHARTHRAAPRDQPRARRRTRDRAASGAARPFRRNRSCRRAPSATTRPAHRDGRAQPGARKGAARHVRLRRPRRRRLARAAGRQRRCVLELATQTDQLTRQSDEMWKKSMDALGVRVDLRPAQWAENLKACAQRQAS